MEAIGPRANDADEVVEQAFRENFLGPEIQRLYIRRRNSTTWTKRNRAITFARGQDPDPYWVLAAKWNDGKWYCSKLS